MTRSRGPQAEGGGAEVEPRSIASGQAELVTAADQALGRDDDLPVVARLVVEIRSDGTRTVARGAVEDLEGRRVAVQAEGATPWALAKQLAGALWTMPRLPRPRASSLRALLPRWRRDG
jgi:hypothetical protein